MKTAQEILKYYNIASTAVGQAIIKAEKRGRFGNKARAQAKFWVNGWTGPVFLFCNAEQTNRYQHDPVLKARGINMGACVLTNNFKHAAMHLVRIHARAEILINEMKEFGYAA